MNGPEQLGLFGPTSPETPPTPGGFRYQPDFLSTDEERELVSHVARLPFEAFEFHGYLGKRRVVSFGWRYEFEVDDVPPFVLPLRARAAGLAGLGASDLQHVLVTEYAPGAGIGWHRDKAAFDEVIGMSLLSACDFRLRRRRGDGWERVTVAAAARSADVLAGPARTEWEHSIPAVNRLRYSITFRNVRGAGST